MSIQPWMFGALEEQGMMTTSEGRINRLAHYLAKCEADEISDEMF